MTESFPSILCADDDAEVLEELKEYFTLKGFIVLTASNGVEACLQVKRWGPCAVILDLLIPAARRARRSGADPRHRPAHCP